MILSNQLQICQFTKYYQKIITRSDKIEPDLRIVKLKPNTRSLIYCSKPTITHIDRLFVDYA